MGIVWTLVIVMSGYMSNSGVALDTRVQFPTQAECQAAAKIVGGMSVSSGSGDVKPSVACVQSFRHVGG